MADLIVAASVTGCFVMGAALIACIDLKAIARELHRLKNSGDDRGDGGA